MSFMEDYKRGMESLFLSAPTFATLALSLGVPIANEESNSRAFVSYNTEDKKINFNLQPSYIATLEDDEIGAVIAHETYHVLLGHLQESFSKDYPIYNVLLSAHECIINDGLEDNVGLALPDNVITGEIYQHDFSFDTTREAYDFICKKQEIPKNDNSNQNDDTESQKSDDDDDTVDNDSSGTKDTSDDDNSDQNNDAGENTETEDEKSENSQNGQNDNGQDDSSSVNSCGGIQISQDDFDNFAKAVTDAFINAQKEKAIDEDDFQDLIDNSSSDYKLDEISSYGNSSGAQVALKKSSGLALNWENLLARINPSVKDFGRAPEKTNWNRPPRRMSAIYPKIILPSVKKNDNLMKTSGNEIPTFLIFVDISYSIPRWIANKTIEMGLSVPRDKINARVFTFNNIVTEINLDHPPSYIRIGGGTVFNSIVEKVEEVRIDKGKDPYVLVITDYEAYFSSSKKRLFKEMGDKWFWMGIPNYHSYNIKRIKGFTNQKDENFYEIEDFSDLKS